MIDKRPAMQNSAIPRELPGRRSLTWDETRRARQRLSGETGAITKDWGGNLPFAFVYPNSYYIGMSNLGLQAIYGLLNEREGVLCERAFWDKENREKGTVPLSVESQRPLTDFAVLAFSLNYEIDYFNIVPMLKASRIPLYSADRDETQPLVIAGGPCITANPMPVAPFFDCLCIGEAEALLPPILPAIENNLSAKRDTLLRVLSRVPGIYVPRFPPAHTVVRQWPGNLDECPIHSIVLTRDTELNDMYLIEVERGCAHGCRFCLVSNTFSPVRFHSVESILKQARQGLQHRSRIGLVGPAVTDHPATEELLGGLLRMGARLSVSSLRISSLTPAILEMLAKGGLRSIALAPEAGSACLRDGIKKDIDEDEVLRAIDNATENGMQQLKLYFMLGLPQETDADVQGIVDLALAAKVIIDGKHAKTRLSLNVSPFVPKAGTPFQWLPMESLDLLNGRLSFLKNQLAKKGLQVKHESPHWSEVQAVLSRGDSDLAQVLIDIDRESLPAWRKAVQKHQIDVDYYAHRKWPVGQRLPWSFIDSGGKPGRLESELEKAVGNSP